jgi:hypothetical protein
VIEDSTEGPDVADVGGVGDVADVGEVGDPGRVDGAGSTACELVGTATPVVEVTDDDPEPVLQATSESTATASVVTTHHEGLRRIGSVSRSARIAGRAPIDDRGDVPGPG